MALAGLDGTAGSAAAGHGARAPDRGDGADTTAQARRQELLRALGAVALSPPPQCAAAAESLGLPVATPAEHTGVFVLDAPPHAAIYLGEEGKLGGEGADRVAGFWRVLGLDPPADADHLGTLLILAAELGDAAAGARSERAGAALTRAREALIWEHLWSWAPGYLGVVARSPAPALAAWARLTMAALAREARQAATPAELPLALRAAPPALGASGALTSAGSESGDRADSLLDGLLTPARSGVLITREDLRQAAEAVGVGYRLGERRYALAAMFGQDAAATLGWLAVFARRWRDWHLAAPSVLDPDAPAADPRRWWAERAGGTALLLEQLQKELVATG